MEQRSPVLYHWLFKVEFSTCKSCSIVRHKCLGYTTITSTHLEWTSIKVRYERGLQSRYAVPPKDEWYTSTNAVRQLMVITVHSNTQYSDQQTDTWPPDIHSSFLVIPGWPQYRHHFLSWPSTLNILQQL